MDAIREVERYNLVRIMQQCQNVQERIYRLMTLVPQVWCVNPMVHRRLLFYLQKAYELYKIDFGVCNFYVLKEERQFCRVAGGMIACSCDVPQAFCSRRDIDGKPKYPELLSPQELERIAIIERRKT